MFSGPHGHKNSTSKKSMLGGEFPKARQVSVLYLTFVQTPARPCMVGSALLRCSHVQYCCRID